MMLRLFLSAALHLKNEETTPSEPKWHLQTTPLPTRASSFTLRTTSEENKKKTQPKPSIAMSSFFSVLSAAVGHPANAK